MNCPAKWPQGFQKLKFVFLQPCDKVYFVGFRESPDDLKDIPSTCMVGLFPGAERDLQRGFSISI